MMRFSRLQEEVLPPALVRLRTLAPLGEAEIDQLRDRCARLGRRHPARRDVFAEGSVMGHPMIVADGWACRFRLLSDGRRQIVGFLLPGDVIGYARHAGAVFPTTIGTITQVRLVDAPLAPAGKSPIGDAYAVSGALEEAYLYNHVVRLGRQTAYERIAHLFLELRERLSLAGIGQGNSFPMPLTQELLADTLGLTSVHINRTLQLLRREQMLEVGDGMVTLIEADALMGIADFRPARVVRDDVRPN